MIYKKILAVVLSVLLLLPNTLAAAQDFWETMGVANLQDNTHGLRSYQDANGNTVHSIGGSLVIKRPQPNFPLWFSLQAPGIKASCSGISFKGMFGSMVNLDEIAEQFEEAGASLAWGVLVGIIYSLPGIGEIFAKLDAWAKKIQKMLANACKNGIGLGKELGNMAMGKSSKSRQGDYSDASSWIDDIGGGFGDAISKVDKILDCANNLGEYTANGGDCEKNKKDTRNELGISYVAMPSIFSASTFSFYKDHGNTMPFVVNEGEFINVSPSNFSEFGGTGLDANEDYAIATVLSSVFGEVVIDAKDARGIMDVLKTINPNTLPEPIPEDRKASLTQMQGIINGGLTCEPSKVPSSAAIGELARYFIYGNTTELGDTNSTSSDGAGSSSTNFLEKLWAPNMIIYHSENTGTSSEKYAVIATKPGAGGSKIDASVLANITGYEGVAKLASDAKDCYIKDIEASCSTASIGLVDMNTARYLAKIYKNTHDPVAKQDLESSYEQYVTYHLLRALQKKVDDILDGLKKNLDKYISDEDATTEPAAAEAGTSSDTTVQSSIKDCTPKISHNIEKFSELFNQQIIEFSKSSGLSLKEIKDVYDKFAKQNKINIKKSLERVK